MNDAEQKASNALDALISDLVRSRDSYREAVGETLGLSLTEKDAAKFRLQARVRDVGNKLVLWSA